MEENPPSLNILKTKDQLLLTICRPYVAQGAAQAVEDAATLAIVLSNISSRGEIPKALVAYEIARKSRAESI